MSSETRSTISGWLGSLGFGEDPTWAAAITRTVGAALGLYILYWAPLVGPASESLVSLPLIEVKRPHFGQYHDAVLLVAYLTFSYFSLSLVLKGIKEAIAGLRRKERLDRGEEWWSILQEEEILRLQTFINARSPVIGLMLDDTTRRLVELGAIQQLFPGSMDREGSARFRCNESIWTFAMSRDKTAKRRNLSGIAKRLRNGLSAVSDLEKGIQIITLQLDAVRKKLPSATRGDHGDSLVNELDSIRDYLLGTGQSLNPERFPIAAEKIKEGNKALEKFRKASNKIAPSPGDSDKPDQG